MRKIVFLFFVFVLIHDSFGFGLFPVGRKRMGNANHGSTWNSNGFGISYKYQYSLQWDEETCRTRTGHDIGYVKTQSMNPENDQGFFNPGITTSQGYWYWDLWNGTTCRTTTSDNFTPVVPTENKAFCKSLGFANQERVCFTTKKAPSSKRELYQWLAEIDYAFSGKSSQENENLKKVRAGDDAALNAGYKTFKDIQMKWIREIKLDTDDEVLKKYISPFRGQKMICARARGLFTSASNPACSEPEKCLALDSLHLLIKCLPVPMGPPPHPFTPFIVGKESIYSVPVKGMQYIKPEVRIVYFEKNVKKVEAKNNLVEGINVLNGSKYSFRVDVDDDSICSFVTHVHRNPISSPYPIGCQNRGVAPKPDIESKNPIAISGREERKVSGQISYPWQVFATLRPTSLDELKDPKKLDINEEIFVNEKYGNVTVFQGGFNRNPEKKKFDLKYLEKKMCSSGSPSALIVEYISVDGDCYSLPSMLKKRNIDVFKCTNGGNEEVFVSSPSDCTKLDLSHDGGSAIKGNQCHNDQFVSLSEKCEDISSAVVYEHDDDGKKLCMRNWNFGEKRYVLLRRDSANPINVQKIKVVEANYVLMRLDGDGNIDFTKNPESFDNFQQDELDYFKRLDESHYWYKNADRGMDIRYRYGPKLFEGLYGATTTYLNAETGEPVFLLENDELLEADPNDQNLCTDAIFPNSSSKTWNYTLQMPGYYTNYDDAQFNNDPDLKNIESQLIKTPGMISINGNTVEDLSKFDDIKKTTLLIPTQFEKKAQVADDAILGIANDTNNRKIKFSGVHQSVKNDFNIQSLNFYPDYFENKKQNKILYSNGKDLAKDQGSNALSDKLFDTSSCNLIEFEIWGGGGQSRANPISSNSNRVTFLNDINDALQNNASSGQNGEYVRGRFVIREKSLLKMKVSDASGKISDVPNASLNSINLDDDFSMISVTDKIDKDLQIARAYSGSGKHECQINSNCANLKENPILEKAINENQQLIVQDNNSTAAFTRNNNIKLLEKQRNGFDEIEVAIDAYRGITMLSFSGMISNLFTSLPLSSPITVNRYIQDNNELINGFRIEKALVKLTKASGMTDWKDNGSGNFNEIGSYYYLGQLTGINWSLRSIYFDPKVCVDKMQSCYKSSTMISDQNPRFIYGGNASGIVGTSDNNFLSLILSANPIQKENLITDMNLYCPGFGGCYFNNGKSATEGRFISQPGSAGLIKIKCLKI